MGEAESAGTEFRRRRFSWMPNDDAAPRPAKQQGRKGALRALGLGMVTGACDDDPSAIGTYASAGATLGSAFFGRRLSPFR